MKTRSASESKSYRSPRVESVTSKALEADKQARAAQEQLRLAKAKVKTAKRDLKAAKKHLKLTRKAARKALRTASACQDTLQQLLKKMARQHRRAKKEALVELASKMGPKSPLTISVSRAARRPRHKRQREGDPSALGKRQLKHSASSAGGDSGLAP